ncbi:MAG: hypothetical protein ACREEU_06420, partial [Acetobacteraceae bacterium]
VSPLGNPPTLLITGLLTPLLLIWGLLRLLLRPPSLDRTAARTASEVAPIPAPLLANHNG